MHSLAHNYSVVKYPQFIPNAEINEHRFTFRNSNDFFVPRSILSTIQKMPLIDFILTWNSIDQSLKDIPLKRAFNKTLKLELLDKYQNYHCTRTFCISCMNI